MRTLPPGADVAPLLELSDERDQWQAVALAREAAAGERRYREGYQDGYRAGREDQAAETAADWHEMAARVVRSDPRSFAELEELRHGDVA